MPQTKQDVGGVFIRNFVRYLIVNSYAPEKERILEKIKEIEIKKLGEGSKILVQYIPVQTVPQKQMIRQKTTIQMLPQQRAFPSISQIKTGRLPLPPKTEPIPPALLAQQPSLPQPGQPQVSINLGKLSSLLMDPSVLSVECPGPVKNILVNRSGAIQTTSIVLTKEEIDKVMNEVSDKTRIPLTQGMFKAAFQDLIMTAVISEFVGTRFMIQKMNPFQNY